MRFFCAGDGSETDENALLDFDTTSLIREMESYQKGDMVMQRAREVLARSDFTFKDKIKSRVKGGLRCLHPSFSFCSFVLLVHRNFHANAAILRIILGGVIYRVLSGTEGGIFHFGRSIAT